MDDNASRRRPIASYRRQYKQVKGKGRKFRAWMLSNKRACITGLLFIVIVGLLFGIGSQLAPPTSASTPDGMVAMDYSTFISQVNAGNVLAVAIRGNEINGLLKHPLSATGTPKTAAIESPQNKADDIANWQLLFSGKSNATLSIVNGQGLAPGRAVYSHVPGGADAQLVPLLLQKQVEITTLAPSQLTAFLNWLWRLMPVFLVFFVMLVLLRRQRPGRAPNQMDSHFSQMGRSRARRADALERERMDSQRGTYGPQRSIASGSTWAVPAGATSNVPAPPKTTFADVAGINEVRAELEEIVQFLQRPEHYDRLGAHIPRGALLVGPPGTGKTLLAKAVAGEAQVPFFSISASEFVEMFVGVGASRVRDLFKQARQVAPCVIFIDEIDAVGRKRSLRATGNDERDQTLNQLLVEMDGFDERQAVVVMAATNRVDILDKALLRPGRFDRRITVSVPDRAGREAILRVHTRMTPLAEDVVLERLARMTIGMSGADLANLVNEAALSAARQNLEQITHECFEEALARVQLGALRPLVMSEKDRRIIAYHEGGHALVAHHLPTADTVNRVTILPRGQSLGVTQFTAEEDCYNYSRESLMARIAVGLGGRAAEELVFGVEGVTTGAENDFQRVTDLARRMVTRWGMSEQIGVVFADRAEESYALNMSRIELEEPNFQARTLAYDANGELVLNGRNGSRRYAMAMSSASTGNGVAMNALIDAEVQRILSEGREMARSILTANREQLERLATELMEREQLDRAEFEALFQD